MRIAVILLLPLLAGCIATMSEDRIQDRLTKLIGESMPIQQAQMSQQKIAETIFLQKASSEKAVFLMAFQKIGFDMFEVAKLMEPGDETYSAVVDDKEVSNMRYFILKNQDRLLVGGHLAEITGQNFFKNIRSDLLDKIIEHLELNYKFYMGIK